MKRHYIYRMVNDTTGEFYIGKRSCKGEPAADNKYMGSGKIIKNKVKKHPEQWRKEILCFASSPEQLNQAEKWAIGTQWRDNPLCLNLCPGGEGPVWTDENCAIISFNSKKQWESEEARAAHSARVKERQGTPEARAAYSAKMKEYFQSAENRAFHAARTKAVVGTPEARAAQSARLRIVNGTPEARAANSRRQTERNKVRLSTPQGEAADIRREELLDYLRQGYTFRGINVFVQNHQLRLCCMYNRSKAPALLLSNTGWTYGRNKAYTSVGVKQVDSYTTED